MLFYVPILHLPAASVYLGQLDYTLTHFIRGLNNNAVLNILFTWFTFAAGALFIVLIIAALYLGGYRKEAFVFAIVFFVTNVLVFGLKYTINRPRPSDLGVTPESEPSFPSAHTANAFALATTLSSYHRKLRVVLSAWALLIAFSRVFLGLHYITDVLAGAAVGIVVSLVITRAAQHYDAQISGFLERLPPHRRAAP